MNIQRMNLRIWPAGLLALGCMPAAAADQGPADAILVTATRTPQTLTDTLAASSIITRADIDRWQPASLQDLLTAQAGVDVSSNGPYGKTTGLSLRGTNPGHVLVLVNGLRIGSATAGTASLEFLPLEQIERIEIIRGPRASLYGADAVGGVINVITRKYEAQGSHYQAQVEGGSFDSRRLSAGMSGSSHDTDYSLWVSHFATAGIDAQKDNAATPFGLTPIEPDKDGYYNTSVSTRLSHQLRNGATLSLDALRAQGSTQFDGYINKSAFVEQTIATGLALPVSANWLSRLQVGQARDDNQSYSGSSKGDEFNTRRNSASWQNDFTLSRSQLLTVGADYLQDDVDTTTDYARTGRSNWAVFAQDQITLGAHELTASLRRDDNQAYGDNVTGNAAWGYDLTSQYKLVASYGTAFKAPTFNDLYYPTLPPVCSGSTCFAGYRGNPDLDPEKSRTAELGLKGTLEQGYWSLSAFHTRIDDLITLYNDIPANMIMPANIAKARINGLEFEAERHWAQWRAHVAATWVDPRDQQTDDVLPRRAQQSARLDLDRALGRRLSLGTTLIAQGHRYDDTANTVRLPGFGRVDLRAQYQLAPAWRLTAMLDNVLDRNYETIATYRQPGRAVFVQLGYQTP